MADIKSVMDKKDKAVSLAVKLITLLDELIPKRRETIHEIEDIAAKLQNVKQDVNIAKVVGVSVSILGGIGAVAGVFATGGFALPIVIGGAVTALTGTATNVGADVVGNYISKGKITEAQKILDEDKELSSEVESIKQELDTIVEELGKQLNKKQDDIFSEIILASVLTNTGSEDIQKFISRGIISAVVIKEISPALSSISSGAKFISALEKVTLTGLTKIFSTVFAVVLGVATIVWDIVDLVNTSIDIHNGSQSDAANNLLQFANQLEEGTLNLEELLQDLRSVARTFEVEMREDFIRRIETVAENDAATDDEINYIMDRVRDFAREDWVEIMKDVKINIREFVMPVSHIFRNMNRRLTSYLEEEKKKKKKPRKKISVTIVGHGAIDQDSRLPASLYYMTKALQTVTLYEPWGCSINASVVYGIIMNTIRIPNVRYTGDVFSSAVDNTINVSPTSFNILPKGNDLIPTPTMYPMTPGEGALRALENLINTIPATPDGLVIPYRTGIGLIDLPEAPFFLITNVFSLLASILKIDIDIRYAACLNSKFIARRREIVFDTIYYSTDLSADPAVCMTNKFEINERIKRWLKEYDDHFIQFPICYKDKQNSDTEED